MRITAETHIDIPRHLKAVRSDKFWLFGANEWYRLITPYTPRKDGGLFQNVTIRPKEIQYNSPHGHFIYVGKAMVDPVTRSAWARKGVRKVYSGKMLRINTSMHPKASIRWDKAAMPVQYPKLVRSMQGYINSGRLDL